MSGQDRPPRVLLAGQTPPPHHGQAVMIEALLSRPMPQVELQHLRLGFSHNAAQVGRFAPGKLLHLGSVVARGLVQSRTFRPDLLYYPPAGPNLVPVLRDLATLTALRAAIPRLVLHFHAGALCELYRERFEGRPWDPLFRRAYFDADAAIVLSAHNPPDAQVLRAKRTHVVPCGICDCSGLAQARNAPSDVPEILYVGAVIESKGCAVLAGACRRLWERGLHFRLRLVGACESRMAEKLTAVAGPFAPHLFLDGVRTGVEKWQRYRNADVFCFPSFYEAETFGVVLLEAMMYSLPVVATRWRGIQDVVEEGRTGALVAVRDEAALADELSALLTSPRARAERGAAGRQRYLDRYTLERYLNEMEHVLVTTARTPR